MTSSAETADGGTVFGIKFACRNCGGEWTDRFPPRTSVNDGSVTKRTKVINDECDTIGMHNCECCYPVKCPTCERYADVSVIERAPDIGEN